MKKLLIIIALIVLCGSVGIFTYFLFKKAKQEKPEQKELEMQLDPDCEELLNVLNGGNDISNMLANVDDSEEFRTVREDWLKSMSGDSDIDDALRHVRKINFRKITRKDVEKAIQCGDLETLKKIRKRGFRKWNNRKFVLKAANTPFVNIMKFLAENGADLGVTDDEGHSALYLAANGGNVETAKFLAGWIGDLGDVPVDRFPYLRGAVEALSLDAARHMIDSAITRKKEAGEDLRSVKTRKVLFLELSKFITMERKSPLPEGYAEIQKKALEEFGFKKKRNETIAAAEERFPLYKLLDQVRVYRQAGSSPGTYISGRLEKVTLKYIVISQQHIHTIDIPEQELSKFIPELNRRYRREYISGFMQDLEEKADLYQRKRWEKHLRTVRMNGYYYDISRKIFIHASDILEEELQRSLEKKGDGEN